jgi:hypothetical protein
MPKSTQFKNLNGKVLHELFSYPKVLDDVKYTRAEIEKAFYLGFNISREGFNAEYPYDGFKDSSDPRLDMDWIVHRDVVLKDGGL